MKTQIISPENEIFTGTTEMVVIPGEEGDFAAMHDHAPLVTYLRPGKLEVIENDNKPKVVFFVGGGFVKLEDNYCIIMVDYIKSLNQIDIKANNQKIALLKDMAEKETEDERKIEMLEEINTLEIENITFTEIKQ